METINILYSDKFIRVLSFDDQKNIRFIDEIDYIDSTLFFLEPKINSKRINEFSNLILNLLKKYNLAVDGINLILDSKLAYIATIPLDFTDEIENINSSLIWELSNFFPDSYKNYKISYQKINTDDKTFTNFGNTLIIAYHKHIGEITKRISELSAINFLSINFDNFTSTNFIKQHYNDFIAIGGKKSKVDISYFLKRTLKYYSAFYPDDSQNDTLEKVLLQSLTIPEFSHIKNIIIYGEKKSAQIYDILKRSNSKKKIILINPFLLTNHKQENLEDKNLAPYSFTPLFYKMK